MTPLWWILVLVAVAFAKFYFGSRRQRRTLGVAAGPATVLDATPDGPVPFGYKILWLAFRTDEPEAVLAALLLENPRRANWRSGLEAAYREGVFVSPAVDGWVLAVSFDIPQLGAEEEQWRTALTPMADRFEELHYYATHRVVDYHAWARFKDGELVRAYAYVGESGEVLTDFGDLSDEEMELGLDLPEVGFEDLQDAEWSWPTELNVTDLAGLWSVDPTGLEEHEGRGVGWHGESPRFSRSTVG